MSGNAPKGAVAVSGLTLVTPTGTTLVRDAEFTLAPGEITLLVGPSASGKSSIAYALCGLLDPSGWSVAGRVDIGEASIDLASQKDGAGALVFQSSALFDDLDALDNVRIARSAAGGAAADLIPERGFDLVRTIDPATMPDEASGGMRQRIAILRAIASGRKLLILDEPNSGLDPVNAALFAEGVRDIARETGAPALIIAHHVDGLMPLCDRLLVLDPSQERLFEAPCERETVEAELRRISQAAPSDHAQSWREGLSNTPRGGWFGPAQTKAFLLLGLTPLAILYIATGAAITGATSMFLGFNYRTIGRYVVPLLHDEIVARIGIVELSIAVPLITCLLFVSRNNAVITARLRLLQATGQIDAMANLGVSVARLLVAPIMLASVTLALVLGAVASISAAIASLTAWSVIFPGQSPEIWRSAFFFPYAEGPRLAVDLPVTILKLTLSGALSSGTALYFGLMKERDPAKAQEAISNSIISGALATLLVHSALTIYTVRVAMID